MIKADPGKHVYRKLLNYLCRKVFVGSHGSVRKEHSSQNMFTFILSKEKDKIILQL